MGKQGIDTRLQKHERQIEYLTDKVDFFVRTSLPPVEGIFHDGQIFDAYKFATDLIRSAKTSLLLIDNYVDESVLLPRPIPDYRRHGHLSHRGLAERPRQEDVRLLQTGDTGSEHHRIAVRHYEPSSLFLPTTIPPRWKSPGTTCTASSGCGAASGRSCREVIALKSVIARDSVNGRGPLPSSGRDSAKRVLFRAMPSLQLICFRK